MKRISCFIGSLSSGGAEHQMSLLTGFLAEKGYDITIYTIEDTKDYYPLHERVKRVRLAQGKSYFRKVLSFMKSALLVKADVVISWGVSQNVILLLPLLLRPDVKVICGERNYTKGRNSSWERILYSGLYIKAKYIVANSFSQTEYEKQRHPFYASRMKTITNYTELDRYAYRPMKMDGIVKIGVIARCEEQKNVQRFLQALKVVKDTTNIRFHVDWYGNHIFTTDHQMAYYSECISIIRNCGLENDFSFKDPITNVQDVIPEYNLMCLPSLFEGFSNSLSEYICCGRPVVCSDVSDNHIMVHDSQNGFLFDPISVSEMAASLIKFLSLSAEEQQLMGVKSRKIAEELFNKEKFTDSYISCIES